MLKAIGNFLGVSNIPVYLIVIAIAAYGYMRIEMLKAQNDSLKTSYQQVEDKNKTLAKDLDSFVKQVDKDFKDQSKITSRLRQVNADNQSRMKKLYETFNTKANGEPRDMDKIAKAKPTLLERRINDATKKTFDRIEQITTPDTPSE